MSLASRNLNPGDWVTTDYNTRTDHAGRAERAQIVAVDRERRYGNSQSGVMFQVCPALKNNTPDSWFCADWFEPADEGDSDSQAPTPQASQMSLL